MMRYLALAVLLAIPLADACPQTPSLTVTIEVANIRVAGGDVYVAVFDSAAGYRKGEAFLGQILQASAAILNFKVTIPPGSYLVTAFQDSNGNGKLDKNIFSIPREPIGLGNYNGKGIPPGFDALKTEVWADGTLLRVSLIKL